MIHNDTKNSLVSNLYANYFGFITALFTIANSLIILSNENLLFQYRFDKYFGESSYVLYIMYMLFFSHWNIGDHIYFCQNEKHKRIITTFLSGIWCARFILFLMSPPENTYYAQAMFVFLILIGVTVKEVRYIGKQQ